MDAATHADTIGKQNFMKGWIKNEKSGPIDVVIEGT